MDFSNWADAFHFFKITSTQMLQQEQKVVEHSHR
uniref:Uncharacterized protein n=1 Tax=Parascaris equorum TaxID=6256 RepID=A0A914RIL4_PAREQ